MFLYKYPIVVILFFLVVAIIVLYNMMLSKKAKVKTAYSSLDAMLKKRYDVMPNLVSMVQNYVSHEATLLTKITELRVQAQNTKDINESIHINGEMEEAMKSLKVTVEGYPELKANENYLHMQAVLNDIEEQISAARRTYNAHVENYNIFIKMFPMNLLSNLFGFKEYAQFEATSLERESKIWM